MSGSVRPLKAVAKMVKDQLIECKLGINKQYGQDMPEMYHCKWNNP